MVPRERVRVVTKVENHYTTYQLAALLNMGDSGDQTTRRWIHEKKLRPVVRLPNGEFRIPVSTAEEFIRHRTLEEQRDPT